jgi:hypothetical protein
MAYPSITANLLQAPDVLAHLAPQVTLDAVVSINEPPQTACLDLSEALDPCVRVYPCFIQDLIAPRAANAVDISQTNLDPFVAGQVNSCNSRHISYLRVLVVSSLGVGVPLCSGGIVRSAVKPLDLAIQRERDSIGTAGKLTTLKRGTIRVLACSKHSLVNHLFLTCDYLVSVYA